MTDTVSLFVALDIEELCGKLAARDKMISELQRRVTDTVECIQERFSEDKEDLLADKLKAETNMLQARYTHRAGNRFLSHILVVTNLNCVNDTQLFGET